MLDRVSTSEDVAESSKPFRGKRLTWAQFYALRPDLRPANDNSLIRAEMGERRGGDTSAGEQRNVQNIGEWKGKKSAEIVAEKAARKKNAA